jgi:hypothetical protein
MVQRLAPNTGYVLFIEDGSESPLVSNF